MVLKQKTNTNLDSVKLHLVARFKLLEVFLIPPVQELFVFLLLLFALALLYVHELLAKRGEA